MKPEDVKSIVEDLVANKTKYLWLYILISFALGMVTTFVLEYVKTRSQNLATKSDITELTKKVEEVKSEYIKQIEIFKGNQQLKNEKKKELYNKVEELRTLIIVGKNDNAFNRWDKFSSLMKNIMVLISTNTIFNDLYPERDKIEIDHNNMVKQIEELKNIKVGHLSINFDATTTALESIQTKLME